MRNPFRRRRPTGTVTVNLKIDTSRFEEALRRAGGSATRTGEAFQVLAYRHRIANERELGLAYVDEQLDSLCEHFGMDPHEVWRAPRWAERQLAWNRAQWLLRHHAGLRVRRPVDGVRIEGGVL